MTTNYFAIFRVQKLKSIGQIISSLAHQHRERQTDNADPSCLHKNIVIVAPPKPNQIMNVINSKLGVNKKPAKNSVLASDIVISVSPEYFRPENKNLVGHYDLNRLNDWRNKVEPWIKDQFPDAISVVLHLDESTPHYSVTDIAVNKQTGRLSHRQKYGGDNRYDGLSAWQTKAAECMSSLGIVRGIRGSTATHNDIKKYYRTVSGATPELPRVRTKHVKALPEPTLLEKIPFTSAHNARVNEEEYFREKQSKRASELATRNAAAARVFPLLAEKAKAVDFLVKQNQELKTTLITKEIELSIEKEQAKKIRAIPLAEVLTVVYNAVDLRKHELNDSIRIFELPDGRQITISPDKFFVDGVKDSKGAINLVMYLDHLDYKNAVRLLVDYFDRDVVVAENSANVLAQSKREIDTMAIEPLPSPNPSAPAWPTVSNWLRTICGVPKTLVERLHKFGLVFADKRGNAIFPKNGGGAHIYGTGSRKFERHYGNSALGIFAIPGKPSESDVYLVENPFNAIAIKSMHPEAVTISTSEEMLVNGELKEILERPNLKAGQLFAAFDNNKIGNRMALAACRIFNALRFVPPTKFRSWAQAVKEDPSLISRVWLENGFDEFKQSNPEPLVPMEKLDHRPTPKFLTN